jgi:hypothetical protein
MTKTDEQYKLFAMQEAWAPWFGCAQQLGQADWCHVD